MVKDVGERDKDQTGAAVGLYAVCEAGREYDESRTDRHKSVQNNDVYRFAKQRLVSSDIASENCHGTDTDTESEERLVHGACDHLEDTDLFGSLEAGKQIELQSLSRTRKENAVDSQDHHDHQQREHHNFRDLRKTVLQSQGVDKEPEGDDDRHASNLDQRAGEASCKSACHLIRV